MNSETSREPVTPSRRARWAEEVSHFGEQPLRGERLRHEARRPRAERFGARCLVATRGDDDDRQRLERILAPNELEDLDATDVGHVEIEDDERKRFQSQTLDGLEPTRCVSETEVRSWPQASDNHVAHDLAVVY